MLVVAVNTSPAVVTLDISNVCGMHRLPAIVTADDGTASSKAASSLVPAAQYVAKLVDYNAWNNTVQAQVTVQLIQAALLITIFCIFLPCNDEPTELAGVLARSGHSAQVHLKLLTGHRTVSSLHHCHGHCQHNV